VARELLLSLVGAQQQGQELTLDPAFIDALKAVLTNKALDKVRFCAAGPPWTTKGAQGTPNRTELTLDPAWRLCLVA